MNLAIMLARGPVSASPVGPEAAPDDRELVAGLIRAAVRRGHAVRLFLLGDGVRQVDFGAEMAAAGAQVSLCEADAAMRGIHKTGQQGVFFGSLYDWARLAEDADRVVSLA